MSGRDVAITMELVVREGRCYLVGVSGAGPHAERDGIPMKQALKLARLVGYEAEFREAVEEQALAIAERGRQRRETANDSHRNAMALSGADGETAMQILTELRGLTS